MNLARNNTQKEMMDRVDLIRKFFGKEGILSRGFDNYEFRSQQLEMALAVSNSLEAGSHLMIEAPTGIGKSFAYLVPSILFAKENDRKVIVSTYTINLQEQLTAKDLPLLKNMLPLDFKFGLLKGRNNYLCPKRLAQAMETSNTLFETAEEANLKKIYSWSKKTKDGTLSDIDFRVIPEVWDSVCSERGICTTKTCGGSNSNCFYQSARMQLEKCDVIVVNHHLFFTLYDGILEGKNGYLYNNDFVIFDEAHTLEQVAAEHIAPSVSRDMIRYNLNRLYNPKTRKGFLNDLPSLHIQMQIINLLDLNQQFFHTVRRKLFSSEMSGQNSTTSRIYEKDVISDEITPEIAKLTDDLRALRPACKNESKLNELDEFITRFSEIRSSIDAIITRKYETKENEMVYWAELSSLRPESNIRLSSSPVDLSGYFRTNIFKEKNSCVMTSATLTTAGSFDYFVRRLGAASAETIKLSTPFDYSRQVKVLIAGDIPSPVRENDAVYEERLREWIRYFINLTGGKALVLFTNRGLLEKTGSQMLTDLEDSGIHLLMQSKGASRKILLEQFRDDVNSVLFGLDSFWMGIDVPGESLSNLIITKLPFQVPNHPLIQARIEFIEKSGGNSFLEYSLPEAILKFRQGVGRLIRNSEDKGIIAILDSRIIKKYYGKNFLDSIDECPVEILHSVDCLQ